jgi:hypothetical protein
MPRCCPKCLRRYIATPCFHGIVLLPLAVIKNIYIFIQILPALAIACSALPAILISHLNKYCDITLNILLPILTGAAIYFLNVASLIRNYMPDGLWGYALTSSILIIWNRRINVLWLTLTAGIFITFEWLQAQQLIRGTGDFLDVISYFTFSIGALGTNILFKHLYLNNYEHKN